MNELVLCKTIIKTLVRPFRRPREGDLPFCIIYDHSTDNVNRVPVHVLKGPGATGPPRTPVLPTLYFQPLGPPPPPHPHQQPQPGGGGEGGEGGGGGGGRRGASVSGEEVLASQRWGPAPAGAGHHVRGIRG